MVSAVLSIKVDVAACTGSGQCALTDPAVFDQGDDGIVTLLADRVEGAAADRARTAVLLCPSRALSVAEGR